MLIHLGKIEETVKDSPRVFHEIATGTRDFTEMNGFRVIAASARVGEIDEGISHRTG